METENATVKRKTPVKKTLKILWLVGLSILTLFFAAHLIWRFSGSNQWKFVQERNGVKVYSLKTPGSDLQKWKGVIRVHSTLASLVKLFQDPYICLEVGCSAPKMIERVDDQQQYYYFQNKLPFPFHARDFVMRVQFYQNPQTKEVLVGVAAAPDKISPDNCCFRVTDMNNTWKFTPLADGQVEIEWVLNMNEGGFLPDALLNMMHPEVMYSFLPTMQGFVDREKYQNAKFDFIKEKDQPDATYLKSSAMQIEDRVRQPR